MKYAGQKLSSEKLELVASRFRVLGDPMRLRILNALKNKEYSVNELVEELDATQPNVSKHLRILKESGWLKRRQEGNTVYYLAANEQVFKLCDLMCATTI